MHFDTWYPFSPQKWIIALCSSLVQMKLGVSMFMAKKLMTEMDYQGHTCTTMVGEEVDHVYFVMPSQQYSQTAKHVPSVDNF
jgi:hypothetical protein